jgi:transposase
MANRVKVEIKETVDELEKLIKQASDIKVRERLQALYLLKSGQVTTLKALSKILLKDTATLYRWLKQYKERGLSKFLNIYEPKGKASSIPPHIIEKLRERLQNSQGFDSYQEIQDWLKTEYQIEVGYFVVYRVVRRLLQAKPKAPRSKSAKQDEKAVERFQRDLGNQINLAAPFDVERLVSSSHPG